MSKDDNQPKPMDAGATETRKGTQATNSSRVAYALKTLVKEVETLFPETPYEFSEEDGRNTALAVTFDISSFEGEDRLNFTELMIAVKNDNRVAEVLADTGAMYVRLVPSARTQDSRESFDLSEIWLDLSEENEGFASATGETEFITDDLVDGESL